MCSTTTISAPKKIDQGLGAIDPTAVCTVGNRLDALSEETIGAIYVDQIFSGADIRLKEGVTNDQLLWDARGHHIFDVRQSSRKRTQRATACGSARWRSFIPRPLDSMVRLALPVGYRRPPRPASA